MSIRKSSSFDTSGMISENLGISGTKIILNKETSILRKSLWLLLVLSMTGVMIWQIIKRLETFFSHPLAVNIEIQHEKYARFPVIVICNENSVTVSGAYGTKSEIGGKIINQLIVQKDYWSAFREVFQNPTKRNETLKWFEEKYGQTEKFMIGTEGADTDIALSSHKLSRMLKYCVWQNEMCSTDYFRPILDGMTMNQCYAFNANDHNVLYTNLPGMLGALRLHLNIEQYEYAGTSALGAGVTVAVLDEMANIYSNSELGHHLSAGKLPLDIVLLVDYRGIPSSKCSFPNPKEEISIKAILTRKKRD